MTRDDYARYAKDHDDAVARLDAALARVQDAYIRDRCPVELGEIFVGRLGREYIVSRIEVESPDLFALYGGARRVNPARRVETFVGYVKPAGREPMPRPRG